jgi:hypothetical protein
MAWFFTNKHRIIDENHTPAGILMLKAAGLNVSVNGGCVKSGVITDYSLSSWKPRLIGWGGVTSRVGKSKPQQLPGHVSSGLG